MYNTKQSAPACQATCPAIASEGMRNVKIIMPGTKGVTKTRRSSPEPKSTIYV